MIKRRVVNRSRLMFLLFIVLHLFFNTYSSEPVKIIFDTDMRNDCDDVGALAILHALANKGEAEILAVVTNVKTLTNTAAGAVDAINTFYKRPNIPIGTYKEGEKYIPARASIYTSQLKNEFLNNAELDDKMPDALTVYREVLSSQPDSSVVICSVGALSNLADLILSRPDSFSNLNGVDLIRKKVKKIVIMGGGFPRTHIPETNIRLDPSSSVTVTNHWPGIITWLGFEVGLVIRSGSGLLKTDLHNPVRRAFELRPFMELRAIDLGKPSHDQVAVLIAVRGHESSLWNISPKGRVVVDSEGNTEWKHHERGKHHYVSINSHPEYIENIIDDLMSASPNH